MRRAHPRDLPGVYRVCLLTGAAGSDASGRHADPDLLGHLWAGPYLLFPDAVTRVVHDERGVAGYCVAVPETAVFEHWLEAHWLPMLRLDHPLGSGATEADRALVERIHSFPRTDPAVLGRFPGHLHIDLLPRLQGQGWGRRLVEVALADVAAAGATGLHLGVDGLNAGAAAFYRRLGFEPVDSDDSKGLLLGTELPGETRPG